MSPRDPRPHEPSSRDPDSRNERRLPLIALSDLVHFPRTRVRLTVGQPRYRRLVRDLLSLEEESRLVGLVLVKPGAGKRSASLRRGSGTGPGSGDPGITRDIFPGGTAAHLVEAEVQSDGRSTLVLEGLFRFVIRREVDGTPYRRALVEAVTEPGYQEDGAGIVAVRRQLLDLASRLAAEIPDSFPLDDEAVEGLRAAPTFEELVNSLAAELELSTLDQLELLAASLPDRALDLLERLQTQAGLLDLLHPFRPLAGEPDLN